MTDGNRVLIHIGKCGGKTLEFGLEAKYGSDVEIVHIKKPEYDENATYFIVARNPIARVHSAFRWRYKKVITRGRQHDRFPGEREALLKYERLENIAKVLYFPDGSPNHEAQQELRTIHHIREDISFYLTDFLERCEPGQIEGVLMQENLDADILRVFGYENELHRHRTRKDNKSDTLSPVSVRNLARFFSKDYEALTRLYCWGKIEHKVYCKAVATKLFMTG